jgi:preprotein translocase subunit SecY/protein transport protein SEC61 subunit alpha
LVRFIEIFQPLARFIPTVSSPERKVSFNEKLFWTAMVLIGYLVMTEIPLYGVGGRGAEDPFSAMRVIFASERGTLMELGIGPIVTAGLILQVLAGSQMIKVDFTNPEDRSLFTTASKVLSILMYLFQVAAYMLAGAFGATITVRTAFVIALQLVSAGIVLMLLDELLQKGWGLGSGISLFIVAGVAQRILWDAIAPMGPMSDKKFLGAIIAFAQSIGSSPTVWNVLHRPEGLPDMIGFLTTLVIFALIIYIDGLRVEVPVSHARYRGFRGKFPIKLLYVSNIPVIFTAALFGNIYFISQLIWSRYNQSGTNFWLNLLGTFQATGQRYEPASGLAYYVVSPRNLENVMQDPVRALVYAALMMTICVFFSTTWIEVGGMDARTIAKQLVDSGMQIEGFRRSYAPIQQVLSRYIPTVTVLGGLIIGAIASFADFFGAFGSGMGILLSIGIIEQYSQILAQERISELYPAARALLGK